MDRVANVLDAGVMNLWGCEIQEELERLQKRLAEAEADEAARRKPTDDKATKGTMVVEGLVIDEWVWCCDFVKLGHVCGLECCCAHEHSCVFAVPACIVAEALNREKLNREI